MGNENKKIDFGTSETWRRYYAETQAPRKLKKREPKTIKVAGMTLNNIDPDAPVDEKTAPKLMENLQKLGLLPLAEKPAETPQNPLEGKTDFLDLVPAVAPKEKPKLKGGKPINPPWHGDPEPSIAITTDFKKRRRALNSSVGHDNTMLRQEWRKKQHLPEIAPPSRNLLFGFTHLTPNQIESLQNLGYHPERMKKPNMQSQKVRDIIELMLSRLQQAGML